jgi:hypothetical protein
MSNGNEREKALFFRLLGATLLLPSLMNLDKYIGIILSITGVILFSYGLKVELEKKNKSNITS